MEQTTLGAHLFRCVRYGRLVKKYKVCCFISLQMASARPALAGLRARSLRFAWVSDSDRHDEIVIAFARPIRS